MMREMQSIDEIMITSINRQSSQTNRHQSASRDQEGVTKSRAEQHRNFIDRTAAAPPERAEREKRTK